MNSKMMIGWSEIDLTPDCPVFLAGQFAERISESVETKIFATSMAVDTGSEQMVICACDLVAIGEELTLDVRGRIKNSIADLDPNKVIISATHTHTAMLYARRGVSSGATLEVLKTYLPAEKQYVTQVSDKNTDHVMSPDDAYEYIADLIVKSITEAWNNRKAGYLINAFGRAVVGHCRRVGYDDGTARMWGDSNLANFEALEGGNDSGVELMYVFDDQQQLTGVVANIACPAQTVQHRKFISADYWGKTRLLLQERFGPDIRLLALCGAAGDQCPVDMIRWVEPKSPVNDPNIERSNVVRRKADPSMFDIEGSWTAGRRVYNEIVNVYETLDKEPPAEEPVFEHVIEWVDLPVRKVTMTEYREADKLLKEYIRDTNRAFDYNDNAQMHLYAGTIARYQFQQTHHLHATEVHVIRLGNFAIATNPFELFLNYGNQIKARSLAEQTFLIQLACGSIGYLPTAKAESGSHYSAYVSSGIIGHQGGDLLVRTTLDRINNLFQE
ncbi:MAG: hypothetical protein GXY22_04655 [Clostridiaceae bacterium]|nr:hypothetical protein [Clostridiaceae bacterium]